MLELLSRYTQWLHSRWPAGGVEKLPQIDESGCSNIPGFYIVGDLTGIPLLKFSSDSGARAVQHMMADGDFQKLRQQGGDGDILDVAIIGAGVSGYGCGPGGAQGRPVFRYPRSHRALFHGGQFSQRQTHIYLSDRDGARGRFAV